MTEETIVATVWNRQRQWSGVADQLKSRIVTWRKRALVLGAIGAVLQTLSASLEGGSAGAKAAAVVGALALAAVPFIALHFLGAEQVRKWLRARSVSEALKSEVYRFRAAVKPYDEQDRGAKLNVSRGTLERWAEELAPELANITPDSKPAPDPLDTESYIEQRVNGQIDSYYRRQARKNARSAALCRNLELATAAAAAALGTLASVLQWSSSENDSDGAGAWVAVLTTIGGAVTAHAAANRYDQQARMYFATARELEDLRDEWIAEGDPKNPEAWTAFVDKCEGVISAENRGWMAKLDPEEKKP